MSHSKLFILLFLLFLLPNSIQAQLLNIESARHNADSVGWYGQLEFDLSLNQYNDKVLEFTNESSISYFSNKHAYLVLNKLKAVNLDGASVISSGYGHLRTTFLRVNRLSPELFLQYQYNNNLGLQNRTLGGTVIRYSLFDEDNWSVSLSSGFMAEYEEWKSANQPAIKNRYIKSTSNIHMRAKLTPQSSLLVIGYYQARPTQFFQARSILETKLQFTISSHISLGIQFTASFDADPVIDIPQWTYELSNGLIISF
ncbi:MAG: DUF481 domain-containing protein [Balneolaceae bacterium]